MKDKINKDVQYEMGSTSQIRDNVNQDLEPRKSKRTRTKSGWASLCNAILIEIDPTS